MTEYTKLADAAVRAGVGQKRDVRPDGIHGESYCPPKGPWWMPAQVFIKDGRTVLALMEKINQRQWLLNISDDTTVVVFTDHDDQNDFWGDNESLAAAIAEATLRALGEIE